MSDEARCMALTGTVWTGPQYCGMPAKTWDEDGRPLCGRHKGREPWIPWRGELGNYPYGVGGDWKFRHGEPR